MTTQLLTLGGYILKRRRALGLSRQDLADRLTNNGYECTESAVNHWEHYRADPPIKDVRFARALALSLDVSPSDLLKAAGMFNEITPEIAQEVIRKLTPLTLQLLKNAGPKDIKKVETIIRTVLAEDEQ